MVPGGGWTSRKERWSAVRRALPSQPMMARRSGRGGRGKVVFQVKGGGDWSAHGKPRVILEAEGQSHEDVKDEELADDKSLGSQRGKDRRWSSGGQAPSQGTCSCPLIPCTPALSFCPCLSIVPSCSF